jgi:hypothetical protein
MRNEPTVYNLCISRCYALRVYSDSVAKLAIATGHAIGNERALQN